MFKFIHAADIHLDSPLRGLERYEHAPVDTLRGALRQALHRMVELAIAERVDFVLIAGDVYDRDWPDFNTGLCFTGEMRRLADAGIPVVMIAGNHDAANKMTKTLRLPDNVRTLGCDQPETFRLDNVDVMIHGQGFATGAVTEDLSAAYPQAAAGCFNIGLLHTCAGGYEGHDRYAPCTLPGLRSKQYNYWALGHIHTRDTLSLDADAPIVFPGNLQGRHIRESGPKGCLLVSVDDRQQVTSEFRPLDVFRWQHCPVDASEAASGDEILNRLHQQLKHLVDDNLELPLAVRVEVRGNCPAHDRLAAEPERWTNEIRAAANDLGGAGVWVEKVKWNTQSASAAPSLTDGPLGELMQLIEQYQSDDAHLGTLAGELSELKKKLPQELREGDTAMDLDSPEQLRNTLEQVRHLLVGRLLGNARV